jgi:vacuolar protein sorting-associated protein 13A/C
MGPTVEACMGVIEDHDTSSESDLHILEKINLSFSVQLAITNAPNLTVAGDLPELQVNFSDKKYSKSLYKCLGLADNVRNLDEVHRCCYSQIW